MCDECANASAAEAENEALARVESIAVQPAKRPRTSEGDTHERKECADTEASRGSRSCKHRSSRDNGDWDGGVEKERQKYDSWWWYKCTHEVYDLNNQEQYRAANTLLPLDLHMPNSPVFHKL